MLLSPSGKSLIFTPSSWYYLQMKLVKIHEIFTRIIFKLTNKWIVYKARKIRFVSLNINSLLLKINELWFVTKLVIASASSISKRICKPKLDKSVFHSILTTAIILQYCDVHLVPNLFIINILKTLHYINYANNLHYINNLTESVTVSFW